MKRLLVLGMLLVGSTAAAQESEPEGEPVTPPFPVMATMDRVSDHSYAHASFGLSVYDGDGPDTGARLSLGGEYLSRQGFGAYAQFDVAYLDLDGDSETAASNFDLGAVYVVPAGEHTSVVVRGSVALPTGPGEDDFAGFVTNYATVLPRLTDFVLIAPGSTYLRGSASPLYRTGQFFVRGDLGLEVAIDEPDGTDSDPLIHGNVALGFQSGKTTVAGELVTIGTTGDVADGDDRFLHTVAVSVGYDAGAVRPYGAVVVPVDNQLAEAIQVDVAVIAGLEAPFGGR